MDLPEGTTLEEEKLTVTIPYKPRPLQAELHNDLDRFNVIVCHRRFGKTVFSVNEMIMKAMQCKNLNPQYAFISPTIKQAKRNAWPYFKHYAKFIPYTKFNEAELRVDFPNGAKIFILGAENPDSARGLYLDGVVLDEVAQMPEDMWTKVIRPALSDRLGWAIFIGTPDGENAFFKLYSDATDKSGWFRKMIKASESGYVHPNELEAALEAMGPNIYEQEYECSFTSAIRGAYYASLIYGLEELGHIGTQCWDQSIPVITAWDIGIADKTCIWFAQVNKNQIYLIDYYENDNLQLSHYANIVTNKPYTYKYHILPHDVKARSFDTGRTRKEQLESLGLKVVVAPKLSIADGINAVRSILPKCYFDFKTCEEGLRALKHYRTEYDANKGVYKETPNHDWSSHASDAFRYLATGMSNTSPRPMSGLVNRTTYDPFNYSADRTTLSYTAKEWWDE